MSRPVVATLNVREAEANRRAADRRIGRPASGTPGRAPFPYKPRQEVAASLRRTLVDAWADLRRGNHARAASLLEAEVMAAVCDIDTYTVEEWRRVRSQLEEQRRLAT